MEFFNLVLTKPKSFLKLLISILREHRQRKLERLSSDLVFYQYAYKKTLAEKKHLLRILKSLTSVGNPGVFRLDLKRFHFSNIVNGTKKLHIDEVASTWTQLYEEGRYDTLMQEILLATNVRVAHAHKSPYFYPYVTYYLACFFATIKDIEKVRYFADKIEYKAPPDGTDLLPFDMRHMPTLIHHRQNLAIDKGKPSIVLIALPKSASAFFSTAIAKILSIPVVKISIGEGFESYPVPKWVKQVALGGAVTHEHFEGLEDNVRILISNGIKEICVQVRDPRDAVYSSAKSQKTLSDNPNAETQTLTNFKESVASFANWMDQWIQIAHSNKFKIKINFITFQEVTDNFLNTVKKICPPCFAPLIEHRILEYQKKLNKKVIPNFRRGAGGEWRNKFDMPTKDAIWEIIPESVKHLLKLEK